MKGVARLRPLALPVLFFLLAAYGLMGYSLVRQLQAGAELAASLRQTGGLWQVVVRQPAEDLGALSRQVAQAQDRLAGQAALLPQGFEDVAVVDIFMAASREQGFLIVNLVAQPVTPYKTMGGTYRVARYSVQARGDWQAFPALVRRLAQQVGPAALSLENLHIIPSGGSVPDGGTVPSAGMDELRFDLLIYARVG